MRSHARIDGKQHKYVEASVGVAVHLYLYVSVYADNRRVRGTGWTSHRNTVVLLASFGAEIWE